jgi:hypothetical protein
MTKKMAATMRNIAIAKKSNHRRTSMDDSVRDVVGS